MTFLESYNAFKRIVLLEDEERYKLSQLIDMWNNLKDIQNLADNIKNKGQQQTLKRYIIQLKPSLKELDEIYMKDDDNTSFVVRKMEQTIDLVADIKNFINTHDIKSTQVILRRAVYSIDSLKENLEFRKKELIEFTNEYDLDHIGKILRKWYIIPKISNNLSKQFSENEKNSSICVETKYGKFQIWTHGGEKAAQSFLDEVTNSPVRLVNDKSGEDMGVVRNAKTSAKVVNDTVEADCIQAVLK